MLTRSGAAIGILLVYLCGSPVSVLENTLVEKEQLCSMIWYSTDTRPDMTVWFNLSAVETKKLAQVEKRLIELLKETASKELDMSYMRDCIVRFKRQLKFKCESTGDFFATPIIEDHLFGKRSGSDLRQLETLDELDELEQWSDRQWRDFMSKWISDAHHVSILGEPSHNMSDKLKEQEKARVKAQQERLGEAGLKRLAEKLEAAQAENDKPIPDSILESFPVPGTSSIHFIPTTTARGGLARKMGHLDNEIQRIVDKDDPDLPFFIHFEHIPSNFVRIKLVLCTGAVPVQLKPLITLYIMNFFATPVMLDGQKTAFEDVVVRLERDTVAFELDSGPANGELLQITFQVEAEKYSAAIEWLRVMLFDAIIEEDRLFAQLTKLLADIPDEKRDGMDMCRSVQSMLHLTQDSAGRAQGTLVKAVYLKRIKAKLIKDPSSVIDLMKQVLTHLHQPSNFRAFVAADLHKLRSPVSAWRTLLQNQDTSHPLRPLDQRKDLLTHLAQKPGNTCILVPMAPIDSSYALLSARGPDAYSHPDLPAIMVAQAYLDAVEGPLWVAVRGTGLAYGANFNRSIDSGLLSLRIYRSPDAFKAYAAAKDQVRGYAEGRYKLDRFALEGAISSIVMGFADEQPTMGSAAALGFVNQVIRGIGKGWNDEMLAKVREVREEQIRDVLGRYFVPVFEPESANVVVTCAKIMEEVSRMPFGGCLWKI